MDTYLVEKVTEKNNISVEVPGSKSITNRALMLAAISDDICELNGVLFSDDSRAFLDCLMQLGFNVVIDEEKCIVKIKGENGNIPNKSATIHVRSAGTAARFMTVLLSVCGGDYVLQSSEQMKKRPMQELIDSLRQKGVVINCPEKEGHFPLEIHSSGISKTDIIIDTTTSSQYASALLMASVIHGMNVKLTGKRVHGAYIKITLKMLEQFGIQYKKVENTYYIEKQSFHLRKYDVEPDMSAACYFYAMAILLRVKSVVRGLHRNSMQGDIKFLDVLEKMGCVIKDLPQGIEVNATNMKEYNGLKIDMSDFSDQALTMAVVAAFAKTPTTIQNVGHIREQESDRVQVIANELKRLGCGVEIIEKNGRTDINIVPGKMHGAEIETYEDHRVAMSFAMAGLVVDGVIIKNPMCCRKTFENYFDVLESIY